MVRRIWLWFKTLIQSSIGSLRRHPRRVGLGILLGALLLMGLWVVYSIANPKVIVSPDLGPFENEAEYDAFIEANPLIVKEAPENSPFIADSEIRNDKSVVYYIELQTRPLKPVMDEKYKLSYLAVIEHSQKQALDWIRNSGQDPSRLNIVWRPDPSEMRSKLLGESTRAPMVVKDAPTLTPSPTPTISPTPAGRFPQ